MINLLSNSASYSAGWIDPIMTGLLSVGVSDQEMIALCRLAILMFGRHGFGNTEHVDKGDLKKSADALSIIAKYLHEKDVEIRTKTEYAKTFIERLGFGVPTTCGYQFVNDEDDEENDDFECFQYFVMPGLGICVRVRENSTHGFYAFSFTHLTAIPLVISKGRLYIHLPGSDFTVFVWGAAKAGG